MVRFWVSAFSFFTLLVGSFFYPVQAQLPARDSQQPVEISADTLEVIQEEQKAVFSGQVLARQGDINMKAAKMTVYYKGGDTPAASAGGAVGAKGISKIEAEGDVLFTSPTETARATKALYEVDRELITMTGEVVLTRERNVLKGSTLTYNLATGKSVLNAPGTAGGGQGRVKGLFIPQQSE